MDPKEGEGGEAAFTPDRGAKNPLASTPEQTSPLQDLQAQQNSPSLSLVPSQVKNSSPSQNGGCSGNDSLPDAQPRGVTSTVIPPGMNVDLQEWKFLRGLPPNVEYSGEGGFQGQISQFFGKGRKTMMDFGRLWSTYLTT